MKMLFASTVLTMVALGPGSWNRAAKAADAAELNRLTAPIHWLGHDSFRFDGDGVTVYVDPYRLKEGPKADVILITHDHQDHASPADVAKSQKTDTVTVATAAAAAKLSGQVQTVKPGEELTIKGIAVKT